MTKATTVATINRRVSAGITSKCKYIETSRDDDETHHDKDHGVELCSNRKRQRRLSRGHEAALPCPARPAPTAQTVLCVRVRWQFIVTSRLSLHSQAISRPIKQTAAPHPHSPVKTIPIFHVCRRSLSLLCLLHTPTAQCNAAG